MKRFFFLLLSCFCFNAAASVQLHFSFLCPPKTPCEFSIERQQQFQSEAERVLQFFESPLGAPNKNWQIPVKVLVNTQAYERYLQDKNVSLQGESNGRYLLDSGEVVMHRDVDAQLLLASWRHEFSHALLHRWLPEAPLWLQEGLAEIVETYQRDLRGMAVGVHQVNYQYWLRQNENKTFALQALLESGDQQWQKNNALRYQAWALLHHLLAEPQWRAQMPQLVHEPEKVGQLKGLEARWRQQHYRLLTPIRW